MGRKKTWVLSKDKRSRNIQVGRNGHGMEGGNPTWKRTKSLFGMLCRNKKIWFRLPKQKRKKGGKQEEGGEEMFLSSQVLPYWQEDVHDTQEVIFNGDITLGSVRLNSDGDYCMVYHTQFQDLSSRNVTVTHVTSSDQCFLHNLRRWSVTPWRGLRLWMSDWVSVGLPSRLDRRVWIACSHITFVDFSFVDLVFFFRCF